MIPSNDSNDEFGSIVEHYLSQLDCAQSPDRQELLKQHPRLKTKLEEFFSNLDLFDQQLSLERAQHADVGLGRWFSKEDDYGNPSNDSESISFPKIPGYRILRMLGGGSQGNVYKAEQLGTKRIVALKVIRDGIFASRSRRLRFESEVELASRLKHPNIVSIFECGRSADHDFFAMEYIEGTPLDVYVESQELDIHATINLFLPIVGAVSAAHQRGVIHRDLKPGNILVDADATPHILDFGLAKGLSNALAPVQDAVTQEGEFTGTLFYASPEQTLRDPNVLDVRSDVYSLGVILYELLTAQYPYPVENEVQPVIAIHIRETSPQRPSKFRKQIDDDLETILLRTLAKEAERRYQSADQLATELRRYLNGQAIEAKRDSSAYVLRKALWRYRWPIGVASVTLVGFVVFATTVTILYSQLKGANATTDAKMSLVRSSQKHIVSKLLALQSAENYRSAIEALYPDVAKAIGFDRVQSSEPLRELTRIFSDFPPQVDFVSNFPFDSPPDDVHQWVLSHKGEMLAFSRLVQEARIEIPTQSFGDTSLLLADRLEVTALMSSAAEALATVAFLEFSEGESEHAVNYLDGLRLLAIDFSEGVRLSGKSHSIAFRQLAYAVCFRVLEEFTKESRDLTPIVDWVRRDYPLQKLRPAMISERMKWVQICEEISKGVRDHIGAIIDWKALETFVGDSQSAENAVDAGTSFERLVSTSEIVDLIDRHIAEVETWDGLSISELADRRRLIAGVLRSHPAWSRLQFMFPNYMTHYVLRCQTMANQRALGVACAICMFRERLLRWPTNLAELQESGNTTIFSDPTNGKPFGYTLAGNGIVLYSLNHDGEDNNGIFGQWGALGTDVILLRIEDMRKDSARAPH